MSRPEYLRVYDALRQRLAAREWPVGRRIPTISELLAEYGVRSMNTVRQAQGRLIEEGYLRAEQGRGVYVVAYPAPDRDVDIAAAREAVDEATRLLKRASRLLELPSKRAGSAKRPSRSER